MYPNQVLTQLRLKSPQGAWTKALAAAALTLLPIFVSGAPDAQREGIPEAVQNVIDTLDVRTSAHDPKDAVIPLLEELRQIIERLRNLYHGRKEPDPRELRELFDRATALVEEIKETAAKSDSIIREKLTAIVEPHSVRQVEDIIEPIGYFLSPIFLAYINSIFE